MIVFILAITLLFAINLFFRKISLLSILNAVLVLYLLYKYYQTHLPGYRYFSIADIVIFNYFLVKSLVQNSETNLIKEIILYIQDFIERNFKR